MNRDQLRQMIIATAERYGVSPQYMLAKAGIESSFNPNIKSPRSSATGLFQFTRDTWRQYGQGKNVRDPQANTDAAARFALDNAKVFRNALGREPTPREMYLMHQQGSRGAIAMIKNPDASARQTIGSQYRSARIGRQAYVNNIPPGMRGRELTNREFLEGWGRQYDKRAPKDIPNRQLSETPTLSELRSNPFERDMNMARQRQPSTEEQMLQQILQQSGVINPDGTMNVRQASMLPPIRGPRGRMIENPVGKGAKSPNVVRQIPDMRQKEDMSSVKNAPRRAPASEAQYPKADSKEVNQLDEVIITPPPPRAAEQPTSGVDPNTSPVTGGAYRDSPNISNDMPRDPNITPIAQIMQQYENRPASFSQRFGAITRQAAPAIGTGVAAGGADQLYQNADSVQKLIMDFMRTQPNQNATPEGTVSGQKKPTQAQIEERDQSTDVPVPQRGGQTPSQVTAPSDPGPTGVEIVERNMGLPRGTAQGAGRVIRGAMQNPATRQAAGQVATGIVGEMARQDALRAQQVQQAQQAGTLAQFMTNNRVGGPGMEPGTAATDRMVDMAVMQDNQNFGGLMDFFMGGG